MRTTCRPASVGGGATRAAAVRWFMQEEPSRSFQLRAVLLRDSPRVRCTGSGKRWSDREFLALRLGLRQLHGEVPLRGQREIRYRQRNGLGSGFHDRPQSGAEGGVSGAVGSGVTYGPGRDSRPRAVPLRRPAPPAYGPVVAVGVQDGCVAPIPNGRSPASAAGLGTLAIVAVYRSLGESPSPVRRADNRRGPARSATRESNQSSVLHAPAQGAT